MTSKIAPSRIALSIAVLLSGSLAFAQSVGVAADPQASMPSASAGLAPAWGGASESILNISAWEFEPSSSTTTHTFFSGAVSRHITGGPNSEEWISGVSLPSGALVTGLGLQGCDLSSTGQISVALIRQTNSGGTETVSLVGGGGLLTGVPATPGCVETSFDLPSPATIDNLNNSYHLLVTQANIVNGDLRFSAVRVRYRLQVSPPPGGASFGDVPTSHPFFAFVEALAASGITAGCGSGNFCPDDPLTRGQMAVFLAVALGLHFPN